MLNESKVANHCWEAVVTTTCYTQNIIYISLILNKNLYESNSVDEALGDDC